MGRETRPLARLRARAELEVRQAWLALRPAEADLETAGRGVEPGQEALRLANVRYQAGVTTNLEGLSRQAALSQAEFGLTQALFNYNVVLAQLERAAGVPVC